MDSDDDLEWVIKAPRVGQRSVLRRRWNLLGRSAHYIRSLEVDKTVENTCKSFEELPYEISELIMKHLIGFFDTEESTYYSIFQSRLLANVSIDFWRKMHCLPPIQFETRSLNNIDIWSGTSDVDDDGDQLEVVGGMWSGLLRLLPHASPKRSVLWDMPPLLDVRLQMSIKSFVNQQMIDDMASNIHEVQSTFELSKTLLQFTRDTFSTLTIDKRVPIEYVETIRRSYAPLGPVEVDEDGDKVLDDEQPRRLLLTSTLQNKELKAASFGASPFTALIDRSETVLPTLTLEPKSKIIEPIFGQSTTTNPKYYGFCYDIEEILKILEYPLDETKDYELSERRARKRAMEMFSKVREIEDEANIAKLMQEHDEESFERTEGKRLKANGSSSGAGCSSAAPVEAVQTYLGDRERRLKTEYEQLMGQLGGTTDAMVISHLNTVEGRIAEIQAMMRAFS